MIKNKHRVEQIAWKRWGSIGQIIFNTLYVDILRNQHQYIHPETSEVPREQWKTTAWNLAWIAAEASKTISDDIAEDRLVEEIDYTTEHDVNLYSLESEEETQP